MSNSAKQNLPMQKVVALDAKRMSTTRALTQEESRVQSQALLDQYSYLFAIDTDEAKTSIRKLIRHGISIGDMRDTTDLNFTIDDYKAINKVVSKNNTRALAKLSNNKDLASHYKMMGLRKNNYGQYSLVQLKKAFNDFQEAYAARQEFLVNKTDAQLEQERQQAQALILIINPEQENLEYDNAAELSEIQELVDKHGYSKFQKIHIMQAKPGDFKSVIENPIVDLYKKIGGFGALYLAGHTELLKQEGTVILSKKIFKPCFTLIDTSYSQKSFKDLRPDANILELKSAHDQIGRFYLSDNGNLQHSTLDEINIDALLSDKPVIEEKPDLLDNLDLGFDL